MDAEPTQGQLLTGLVTTTIFEATALFSGAVVIALSRAFNLPFLGFVGLMIWLLGLWAENYSVAEFTKPAFGLSKPVSVLVMSLVEFATWTIWLLFLNTGLPWPVLLVLLFVLTQIHHSIQFRFFFPASTIGVAMRSLLLWGTSAIEAVAGQTLIVSLLGATVFDAGALVPPLLGLLVFFAVEHLIGGLVRPPRSTT